MKALTDHSIVNFGDVEGKPASLRACEILSFDGDRYCEIEISDWHCFFVPLDYLYTLEGEHFTRWQLSQVPRTPWIADVASPRVHLNS